MNRYFIDTIKSEKTLHLLNIQTNILHFTHLFFNKKNVKYMLPVILSPETDILQGDVLNESFIKYYNQKLYIMKSMIVQKELQLINDDVDSIYTISPCVRLEKKEKYCKGRHCLEFQQIDFEFKNKDIDYLIGFVEDYFCSLNNFLLDNCSEDLDYFGRKISRLEKGFNRFTEKECIEKYGSEYEKIMSNNFKEPFWILDIERWIFDKKENGHNLNYDIILPEGFLELGSGGVRENDYNVIIRRIKEKKLDVNNYSVFLDYMKNGCLKPSIGIGFGVQRLVKYFTGIYDIDEAMIFPRTIDKDFDF